MIKAIAQIRIDSNQSVQLLYNMASDPWAEVEFTKLIVCNTSGGAAQFRLYYNPEGRSFGSGNELWYDEGSEIAAGGTFELDLEGTGVSDNDASIGIRSLRNNVLTATLFGNIKQEK